MLASAEQGGFVMKAMLGAFALAVLAASAAAQESGGPPIIVEAHRDPRVVRNYVETVSVTSQAAGVLGRWNERICPSVAGASTTDAQFIIDRIARRANALGLQTGAPGCSPNITVVVTPNSDRFTQQVYEQRRQILIGANGVESTTLGSAALQDFVNTPRPIRWWLVSQTVMSDGSILADTTSRAMQGSGAASARATQAAAGSGPTAASGGGGEGLSGINTTRSNGTRLLGNTRQDFNYALVIIDSTRTAGAPLAAIADYVAFVALAQVNMSARAADYPTILNLFSAPSDQSRPTQLTAWDIAYLDALYHMTRNARNLQQQRDELTRRIAPAS
ncbi:MAG: hypothetical protein JSS00_08755 [Proteobacteria bacterium]|nr:hypothetical protein [Pseudomonadota bacterium]